jgi:alkylation response protein AidB-like acyl-CoA dehydrogenase
MIAAETNALVTWMPAEATVRIFESNDLPICVGTLNPAAGTARPVDGGYRVEGRWPYASGIRHADWVISRCRMLTDGGEPVLDERAQPQTIAVATPSRDVTVLDTWDTSGLAGTGSEDYSIAGVVVPEGLAFQFGPPQFEGPRASLPLRMHFQVGHAAHALGTAASALEAFRDLAGRPNFSQRPTQERALAQRAVGEAEALTRSARAWLTQLLDEIWERAADGVEQPPEAWALLTLAVAHTVRTCVRAVDLLYEGAGAPVLYRSNRLERVWRDMRAAGQHLHAKERHYADSGQVLLG